MNALILKIAFRYLKSQKSNYKPSLITAISIIGIVISVATLIIVIGVQNGFRTELIKQIIGINAHISITNHHGIENFNELVNKLKNNTEIKNVIPLVDGKGMLINGQSSAGTIVRGISKEDLKIKSQDFKSFDALIDDFEDSAIILGADLAWRLGVHKNSYVTLISPEINETFFGAVPRSKTYKVVGIINVGLSQYNDVLAFIPIKSAQKFFRYNNSVNLIELMLKIPENSYLISQGIRSDFYGSYINTWQEQNGGLLNALNIEKNVMVLILGLFVIVTIFAIFAGLTMMVNDKNKSIAVLRSMGLTRIDIGKIFFTAGMMVIFIGTAIGLFIGIAFSTNIDSIKQFLESILHVKLFDSTIYFIATLPSDLHASDVFGVVIFVVIFGALASVLPAIKATKCKPAEALKYF